MKALHYEHWAKDLIRYFLIDLLMSKTTWRDANVKVTGEESKWNHSELPLHQPELELRFNQAAGSLLHCHWEHKIVWPPGKNSASSLKAKHLLFPSTSCQHKGILGNLWKEVFGAHNSIHDWRATLATSDGLCARSHHGGNRAWRSFQEGSVCERDRWKGARFLYDPVLPWSLV